MKNLNIRIIAGCALMMFLAMNVFGQTATNSQIGTATTKGDGVGIKAAKLDKTKVPKEVTDIYFKEYPNSTYDSWYGYPSFDNVSDWYDYDPYLSSNNYPENYVVEFTQNNIPYTVVYSKSGNKIAAHKMAISTIPKAVSAAINNGAYKTWTLGKDKEEIFKDTDADQLKVYKVSVTMGKEKHDLYYQSDGQLLKDKKVS
jgi:hypothetical protein